MDEWTEQLSEYIDGHMDPATSAALETHLAVCDECSAILEELQHVRSRAAALQPVAPARDLWRGIAAAIAADTLPAAAPTAQAGVVSIDQHRGRRAFAFTLPQLAAAALILIALGAALVWQIAPRAATTIATGNGITADDDLRTGGTPGGIAAPADAGTDDGVDTPTASPADIGTANSALLAGTRSADAATGTPRSGQDGTRSDQIGTRSGPAGTRSARANGIAPAPSDLGYDAAIRQLEAAASGNTQLDTATVRVLQESMKTVDRAIADARAALAADPANAYLHRHLDRTMKQKFEILRRAATIDRGGA